MKRILMASGALALMAGTAFAGGYTVPVTEAAPVAPAPVMTTNADWTGFYAGAQLGYGKAGGDADANGAVGGVHAGYLQDFGGFVGGGELAYSAADLSKDGDKINNFTDLKLIGGVPNGKWLYYGALGASYVKADFAGDSHSDTVPMAGLGVKYQLNDQWVLGSELDYRKGNDFDGTGVDADLTTLGVSASFKF